MLLFFVFFLMENLLPFLHVYDHPMINLHLWLVTFCPRRLVYFKIPLFACSSFPNVFVVPTIESGKELCIRVFQFFIFFIIQEKSGTTKSIRLG